MGAQKILRNAGLLAASGVVALALAVLPVAPGLDAGFAGLKTAQAAGNGGGNGNGNGHGNAGGQGHGNGHGNGNGVSTENNGLNAQSHGITASSLGNLNAAHASATAMSHASINSVVGKIGAAVELAAEEDRSLTIDDLDDFANKDVDQAVVDAVNDLVDGKEVDRSETDAAATEETDEPEET